MRIALLADQYFRRSGVGRYTQTLIRHLVDQDSEHEYVLAYPGRVGAARLREAQPSSRVVDIGDRRLVYPSWHLLSRPRLEWRVRDVDVVHVLSGSVHVPTELPLVHTIHDLASWRRPQDYPWRRAWFKRRMLLKLAENPRARFIAISRATRVDLVELLGLDPSRVRVVPNGLDRERFRAPSPEAVQRARSSVGLPERFFLFVGVPTPRKNVGAIIRAFQPLSETRLKGVDLVFVGSPPDALWAELKRSVGFPVSRGRVHALGYVSDDDLIGLYGAAIALVFPSFYEGFGLPLLEAMACGCPVVASDVTALPEVAGDAALLVPPGAPSRLGDALIRLASEPKLRRTLRERGYERVGHFSWERTARETAAVYASVDGASP